MGNTPKTTHNTNERSGVDVANMAIIALTRPWATEIAGECQKFAREVAEHVGGEVRDAMDSHRAGSAKETLDNFRGTAFLVWDRHSGDAMPPIQDGDFLYKDGADAGFWAGHVGIACNARHVSGVGTKLVVCENSHYHTRVPEETGENANILGAKGWRSLARFGTFTAIVRLTNG